MSSSCYGYMNNDVSSDPARIQRKVNIDTLSNVKYFSKMIASILSVALAALAINVCVNRPLLSRKTYLLIAIQNSRICSVRYS